MIGNLLKGGRNRRARVLALLDDERRVILDGPLSALKAIVERREALVAEILAEGADPGEDFLVALRAKAERNGRLLGASLAGIRDAERRMAETREASETLRTYDAEGAPQSVPARRTTRDQRA